jgi:Xaa-Pro aminopeptidase
VVVRGEGGPAPLDVVLRAQVAAIEAARPGVRYEVMHETAKRLLTEGLVALGLLPRPVEESLAMHHYREFFMHGTSHWLGMDVHDVGDYRVDEDWRLLKPGMTMTIEPGLYIPAKNRGVPKRWWNIGIRIEDDVLVTQGACEVITAEAPKAIADIEALMRDARARD